MGAIKPPSSRVESTLAVDSAPRSVRRYGVFIVAGGLEAGRVVPIPPSAPATFGRGASCTVCFDDDSLSREHATVFRAGGDYIVKDTSTNGSFVNEEKITSARVLRDGDRLQLGSDTLLRFQLVDPEEEAALRRVYDAAILDGLTRVFNRKHLEDRVAVELAGAAKYGTPLSVIIIDVDHFKKVNDTHGHLAGDAVLKEVAARLEKGISPGQFVARYGGEEFVIVCRDTAVEDATLLAERLRAAMAATPIEAEGRSIAITSSAGVASLACAGANDRAALLGTADKRLYAAKEGGRNRVVGP